MTSSFKRVSSLNSTVSQQNSPKSFEPKSEGTSAAHCRSARHMFVDGDSRGQPLPATASSGRNRHAVKESADRCVGGIEVYMCVEPNQGQRSPSPASVPIELMQPPASTSGNRPETLCSSSLTYGTRRLRW